MAKILLVGANGKMGKVVAKNCQTVVCGVDKDAEKYANFEIYKNFESVPKTVSADVVLDFSHPSLQESLINFCSERNLPLVVATTGLSDIQKENLKNLAKKLPVFVSSNLSYGIFVLANLIKEAQKKLNGWDIEIIEKHHSHKVDAPSGTSLSLAAVLKTGECVLKNGRTTSDGARKKNEIGIHAVRGGSVVGDHEVNFFGEQETISISHFAQSKDIFALGAIKACEFLAGKSAGFYEMKDL